LFPKLDPRQPPYDKNYDQYLKDHFTQEVENTINTEQFAIEHNVLNPKGPRLPVDSGFLTNGVPDRAKIEKAKGGLPVYKPAPPSKDGTRTNLRRLEPINPRLTSGWKCCESK
jgi:hypothetical protein